MKFNLKKLLFATPVLKVMDFLLANPDLEFSDADLSRMKIGVKRSAINAALRLLSEAGLVERKKRGQVSINRLIQTKPVITYFKIASNLLAIDPMVEKCRAHSSKMVLFGSRADGTHTHDSDFDVLIVADDKDKISKVLHGISLPLQPIIKLPEEVMRLHETEPYLWEAVSKGIILWEKT